MVDGVDDGFLNGRLREVPEALGFRTVRVFDDRFLQVVALDVADGVAGDAPISDRQPTAPEIARNCSDLDPFAVVLLFDRMIRGPR